MCDSQTALIPPPLLSGFTPSVAHTAVLETDDEFFQFVGKLNSMDVDLPSTSLEASFGESPAPVEQAALPSPPRSTRKVSAEARIQRIREKNRVAQARFRQKQKELCLQAQQKVEDAQEQLIAAKKRREELKEQRSVVTKRTSRATTALNDVVIAAHTPVSPEPRSRITQQCDPSTRPLQSHASQERPGPQVNAAQHHARSSQAVIQANTSAKQRGICTWLPPSISSFCTCQPLFLHQLPEASSCSSFLSSSATDAIALQPQTALGSQTSFLDLIRDHKLATAERLAVGVDDICWFPQMHYEVAPGSQLSFSSHLSSPECVSSFVLVFIASNLHHHLYSQLLDSPAATHSFDEIPKPPAIAAAPSHRSAKRTRHHGPSRHPSAGASPRNRTGAPNAHAVRSSSAGCDSTTARQPRHVRCGVNEVCEEGAAVRAVLRRIVASFVGRLPARVMRETCELLHAQASRVLRGFLDADALHASCTVKQTMDAVQAGMAAGADAAAAAAAAAAEQEIPVEYLDIERYHERVTEAVVSLLKAVCAEVQAMLADLDDSRQISSAFALPAPESRAELQQRTHEAAIDYSFAEALMFLDAPRVSRNLCTNAVIPLMETFVDVENFHVHLYRKLELTAEQRRSMALIWHAWSRRRRALTASMHAAVHDLRSLPESIPLPLDTLSHISDLASGRTSRPSSCTLPADGAAGAAATGCCGCSCAAAAAAGAAQPQLLGAAPAVTAAAAAAVKALQVVHESDAEEFVRTVSVALQPGLMFSPDQHVRYISGHLAGKTAPADCMALCQLAASQAHRAELFGKTTL